MKLEKKSLKTLYKLKDKLEKKLRIVEQKFINQENYLKSIENEINANPIETLYNLPEKEIEYYRDLSALRDCVEKILKSINNKKSKLEGMLHSVETAIENKNKLFQHQEEAM